MTYAKDYIEEKKKYRAEILPELSERCLLCRDAPCTAACPEGLDPARMIRAVRFDNAAGAYGFAGGGCAGCASPCEDACVALDRPVRISGISALVRSAKEPVKASASLETEFLGVKCENPFFLSSSVVASGYEMCARALSEGWAGIVYKTIGNFIPDEASPRFDAIGKEATPFIGFGNIEQISDKSPDENFEILRKLKQNFPTKVIVASIMGRDEDEWTYLAKRSEECGADIIECNFSCPHMSAHGLGADVGTDPALVEKYTKAVKRGASIPVLAKMTPNLTHIEIPAKAAVKAGADGLAAINTIKSIRGWDAMSKSPLLSVSGKSSVSGYSGKAVKPIALRFIHDMAVCPELYNVPISGMGGIETWRDAVDFIAMGCMNLQVTTAVMQYGYRIIDDLTDGLSRYLTASGYGDVKTLCGAALPEFIGTDEIDRETIEFPAFDMTKCVGCGRCAVSCDDGGHQAIAFGEDRKPKLRGAKCVGCQLCRLVCPAGAISVSKRVRKIKH